MTLWNRYRRLTFWNKFGFLGNVASLLSIPFAILGLAITILLYFLPQQVTTPQVQPDSHLFIDTIGSFPVTMPPEGKLYQLQLWAIPANSGGGGLPTLEATAGASAPVLPVASDGLPTRIYVCQITNYTPNPVFNISMAIHETFQEMTKDETQPGTMRSGKTVVSREWPFEVPKIEPGSNSPFKFYVYNGSPYFVTASIANSASIAGKNGSKQPISLVQPVGLLMHFNPS